VQTLFALSYQQLARELTLIITILILFVLLVLLFLLVLFITTILFVLLVLRIPRKVIKETTLFLVEVARILIRSLRTELGTLRWELILPIHSGGVTPLLANSREGGVLI
jgi:hypothetical protein